MLSHFHKNTYHKPFSSVGKGRAGTILAAYLLKKRNVLNAYQAINKQEKSEVSQSNQKTKRIFFSATKNTLVKDHQLKIIPISIDW